MKAGIALRWLGNPTVRERVSPLPVRTAPSPSWALQWCYGRSQDGRSLDFGAGYGVPVHISEPESHEFLLG
jgi:hypothetical protein